MVRASATARRRRARAVRGFADIVQTMRDIAGHPRHRLDDAARRLLLVFRRQRLQRADAGFAHDLGHGDPGVSYSMLLAADAAGGSAGRRGARRPRPAARPSPRTAIVLAMLWCCALVGFALATSYPLALALLFAAGFLELSFNAMAQTLVQLNAPPDIRGRVIGLFNMASLGLRAFSGITVGLLGSLIGVHWSLALVGAGDAGDRQTARCSDVAVADRSRRLHFGEEAAHFALQALRLDGERVGERLDVGGGGAGADGGAGDAAHRFGAGLRLAGGAVDALGDRGDRIVLLLDRARRRSRRSPTCRR